ncbi:hypothetical protein Hanom_Chr12g01112821 [Helianthus anomalus]
MCDWRRRLTRRAARRFVGLPSQAAATAVVRQNHHYVSSIVDTDVKFLLEGVF